MKRLLRDAMEGLWPESWLGARVALANDYLAWSMRRALPLLAPTIKGRAGRRGVHPPGGSESAAGIGWSHGSAGIWRRCMDLWDIACLESWLRGLQG